jgi:hypothetical protein
MNMDVLIIVFLLLCAFVFLKKNRKPQGLPSTVVHRKREHLASRNEQKLLFALHKALGQGYMIHCQVSLIALVEPVDWRQRSRSWAKRMDYVITDKASKVVAVIELDDASHHAAKRQKRDHYVNEALAGHHPLLRIPTTKFYSPEVIAGLLEKKVGLFGQGK